MNETDTLLLTSIYQNCKTATQSIHDLMPRVLNVGLLQELKSEYDNYIEFIEKCLDYAKQKGVCLNENNIFEKMRLWFSVKFSTMFNKTTSLNTIYVSDKFVTDNVSDSSYMFYNNINLVGGNGTTFSNSYKDKTYARIDTEESPGYFTLKSA